MIYKITKNLFPRIKFILGNNAVEPRGVKSNYFGKDLAIFGNNPVDQKLRKKYLPVHMALKIYTNTNFLLKLD